MEGGSELQSMTPLPRDPLDPPDPADPLDPLDPVDPVACAKVGARRDETLLFLWGPEMSGIHLAN